MAEVEIHHTYLRVKNSREKFTFNLKSLTGNDCRIYDERSQVKKINPSLFFTFPFFHFFLFSGAAGCDQDPYLAGNLLLSLCPPLLFRRNRMF